MRAIIMIVLLWVIAVLAVHGWQNIMKSIANGEVERWENDHNEAILKDFPGE